MRLVQQLPDTAPLTRSDDNDERLRCYLRSVVEDGLAARKAQDSLWQECLRRYEAVPKNPVRDVPIENAPNYEVALGAIATDAIQAQFLDTIFSVTPVVTVRPVGSEDEDNKNATALQRRVNHGVAVEWNLRPATDTGILDDVQLGTAVWVVPYVKMERKTDLVKVVEKGPRIIPWPIEDVLVQGGACTDLQMEPYIGLRGWYTDGELAVKSTREGWDVSTFRMAGAQEWVRTRRETLGRHIANEKRRSLYEVFEFFCHFDYDQDGVDEDLYVVFDRASGTIGKLTYNPYDRRPIVAARYQLRAYLFYGMGVLEMTAGNQDATSELMNQGLLNVMLGNGGIIATRQGAVSDSTTLWQMKQVECMDPVSDIIPKKLAEPIPATAQYIAMQMSLAERRVGVNEMAMPRPSQVLGSRTPGITAMSLLQQYNRRFTPAFDQVRNAIAECVRQCLYREQERLLIGDPDLEMYYRKTFGTEDADRIIAILRDPDFDEQMRVELTAASASVNREADRQNALALTQILGTYYEKVLQLVAMASNPQVPQPVRDVARKIAEAGGAIIERTLTTFDQVRDPKTFVIDTDKELDQMQLDGQGLQGLGQLLAMMGGQPGGGGAPGGPPGLPPPAPMGEAA